MPSLTPVAFQMSVLYPKIDSKTAVAFYSPETKEDPRQIKRVGLSSVPSDEDYGELTRMIEKVAKETKGSARQRISKIFTRSTDSQSSENLAVPTAQDFTSWIHEALEHMK